MNLLEAKTPGEVFTGNLDTLKSEFDKLALKYHPDLNGSSKSNDDFINIIERFPFQNIYKSFGRTRKDVKEE